MAEQNLHDIKIDDLDNNNKSKKTPLKNILTLLALLFIILVISVVITRLRYLPNFIEKIKGKKELKSEEKKKLEEELGVEVL